MSLTIATTKRLYLLDLRSVAKTSTRVVRWTYEHEPKAVVVKASPLPTGPRRYQVGYTIAPSTPRPIWTPQQTLDDGQKTYIVFPANLAVMEAPMLRLIGPMGPEVANARLVGSVMILDHLVSTQLELRLGREDTSDTVLVTRGPPRTIHCPGEAECPVWPMAVAHR